MKHAKQTLKSAVREAGKLFDDSKGSDFTKLAGKNLKACQSIKDILGVTDESIEGVYGQAYLLYNTGRYKDAAEVFRLLIMLDSTEPKYLMGLAACYHMMKEYLAATSSYTLVTLVDPENPVPFFHSSDCYIQLQDKTSAAAMLEMAVKRAEGKPEFKTLLERAKITLEALKKELAHGGAKS